MLTAVARDQGWPDVSRSNLSAFQNLLFASTRVLVLFCYITNHLMTDPLWNSEFYFRRISMFPSTSFRETLRFSGNKIHCSPRDQSLSVNYCMGCCEKRVNQARHLSSISPFCPVIARQDLSKVRLSCARSTSSSSSSSSVSTSSAASSCSCSSYVTGIDKSSCFVLNSSKNIVGGIRRPSMV